MTDIEQPVVTPSRRLPSGRAVLGGLLVTLAVLGTLLASRIGITQVEIRLAEDVDWIATDPEQLYGSVLLGPVGRLEFMQLSNVAEGTPDSLPSGLAEVSIEIDPNRAPAQLVSGEIVSILATYDDEEPALTKLIAREVTVLSYSAGDSEFGSGDAVLRLGIAEGEVASDIVLASIVGDISIVGVTGASGVDLPESVTQ